MLQPVEEQELNDSYEQDAEDKDLPKYCDHGRFLLVEELALESDYRELHYGQCVVIGKLRENLAGYFELENIQLPNFPKKHSLPEGAVSVRLFRSANKNLKLQSGRFCEACGEVILWNTQQHSANWVPLTARGVNEKLLRLQHDEAAHAQWLSELQEIYRPAIQLLRLSYIDRAGELAERNLELRLLHDKRLQH